MDIKILLVEDNDLQLTLGTMVLENLTQHIETATTGSEAVEKFFKDNYSLVLMDIGLPDFDGIEATRRIRERNQSTPIVALTANDGEETKKAALAAGMNAYIVKPITIEKAHHIFDEWIKK